MLVEKASRELLARGEKGDVKKLRKQAKQQFRDGNAGRYRR
jgi:hypothetical protein